MKLLAPLFLLLLRLTQTSPKTRVYIGAFFPLSPNKASVPGRALLAAADMALDHVNKSDILRDYELRMIVKDSKVRVSPKLISLVISSIGRKIHPEFSRLTDICLEF